MIYRTVISFSSILFPTNQICQMSFSNKIIVSKKSSEEEEEEEITQKREKLKVHLSLYAGFVYNSYLWVNNFV